MMTNSKMFFFLLSFPLNLHINVILLLKEELHTRILKNLKEREKYSLQNSAKMMKIG